MTELGATALHRDNGGFVPAVCKGLPASKAVSPFIRE